MVNEFYCIHSKYFVVSDPPATPPATQLILHNQPIWKPNNQLIWWYIAPLYNNNFVARQWHSSLAVYA